MYIYTNQTNGSQTNVKKGQMRIKRSSYICALYTAVKRKVVVDFSANTNVNTLTTSVCLCDQLSRGIVLYIILCSRELIFYEAAI